MHLTKVVIYEIIKYSYVMIAGFCVPLHLSRLLHLHRLNDSYRNIEVQLIKKNVFGMHFKCLDIVYVYILDY